MSVDQGAAPGSDQRNVLEQLKTVLDVAAPATVITALLVYIGWIRNQAYYGYFGISQGVLKPSVQDYALRSVDVTFGAVARIAVCALLFLGVDRAVSLLRGRSATGRLARYAVAGIVVVGIASFLVGLLFLVGFDPAFPIAPFGGAALLGAGAILVIRFWSAAKSARGVLYVVLFLGLFWAGTLYAQDLGQRAARGVEEDPTRLPLVTVFSDDYLDLPGSQVEPTQNEHRGKPFYRYTGLSLMTYSNDRWFLITGRYNDDYRPSVVILKDTQSVRVEIAASP